MKIGKIICICAIVIFLFSLILAIVNTQDCGVIVKNSEYSFILIAVISGIIVCLTRKSFVK